VTGEETVLEQILPLVKAYDTSLVILASDESGVPNSAAGRLTILTRIVERAEDRGVGPENLLADCVAESSAVNNMAAIVTRQTMEMVKATMGLNLILGASNVSFGLPDRATINAVFLSLAIEKGLNCAIVNVAKMKPYVMAADLLLGRDLRARRYTNYFRRMKKSGV
jgi:5-methyltetrahydrofolate--homocysteine methyltransferase